MRPSFPLAIPILYYFYLNKKSTGKKYARYTLSLFGIVSLLFIIYCTIPEARNNLERYFELQLWPSIFDKSTGTTQNRGSIIGWLFLELSVPLVLVILVLIWSSRKKKCIPVGRIRLGIFYLLVGLCASIPLIISMKQRRGLDHWWRKHCSTWLRLRIWSCPRGLSRKMMKNL